MKWVSQSLEELHLTLSVCQSLAESWPSAVHRWPHWILTTAVPPGGTIMRIIKCETVDVTWPTLVHTGNKRLSQERIPSLLAAKDPLSRFPKETEAGWEAPEEGWRASETRVLTLESQISFHKPAPLWEHRELWEGCKGQSVSLVPHLPKGCFRVTKKWPSARPSMDGPQLSTSAY